MSLELTFRDATLADTNAIVALNAAAVTQTGPMDTERFKALFAQSARCQIAESNKKIVGFLLGFADGADYDSVNYRWFKARLKSFFYIDRIVIDVTYRKRGIGREFYTDLIEWAPSQDFLCLAAEINRVPLNQASLTFHQNTGFIPIATQKISAEKEVSLQIYPLNGETSGVN